MDIGEVKRRSGLATSTLRYYEEKGLIEPVGRNGLRRVYDVEVLDRLALIALGQDAGFTLDEIAKVYTGKEPEIDRKALVAKADEIDTKIQQLSVMSKGLRHAARCRAENHFECPTFQRLLRLATGKRRKQSGI